MMKAFRFRIYPTKDQKILLHKTFGCVRKIWNYFLAECEDAYRNNQPRPNATKMQKELTQLKQELPYLYEVDNTALQRCLRYLDQSYQRFFKVQKMGPKFTDKKLKWLAKHPDHTITNFDLNGHPQWKCKKNPQRSYTAVKINNNIEVNCTHIKLPKIGWVRYRDQRTGVEGKILNATVTQEASGKYYVSICCDNVETQFIPLTGKMIGIDLGIKEFLITSDGLKIENHRFFKKKLQKLRRLQRSLSRKTKDGKNWEKNRRKLAIQYEKVRHARLDFHHQLTTYLVKEYDVICVETLKIKNMIKNHKLAQAISDVAWGQFIQLLGYKMTWAKKILVKIDTFFPSSQICSCCGYQNTDTKNLSVREWICPQCNTHHDRDINAAKNILNEGLKQIA